MRPGAREQGPVGTGTLPGPSDLRSANSLHRKATPATRLLKATRSGQGSGQGVHGAHSRKPRTATWPPPAASLAAAPVSTNLHRGFRPLPLATQSSPVGDGWPGRGLGWTSLRPAQASGPSATDGTTATTPGGPAIVPGGCRGVHGAAGAAGLVSGNGNILNTKRWESCGARQ